MCPVALRAADARMLELAILLTLDAIGACNVCSCGIGIRLNWERL